MPTDLLDWVRAIIGGLGAVGVFLYFFYAISKAFNQDKEKKDE